MNVFLQMYSIDSDFTVDGNSVISKKHQLNPFRDEPKKFSLAFDGKHYFERARCYCRKNRGS